MVGTPLLLGGYWFLFFTSRLPTLEARLPPEANGGQIRRIDLLVQLLLLPEDWVGKAWFGGRGEFGLWDRLPVLWWAGVVLATGWAAGWLVLRALGLPKKLSPVEKHCFSLAVGASLLSTYTLAVGLAGLLPYRAVFWTPTILLLGGTGWINRNYLKRLFLLFFAKFLNFLKSLSCSAPAEKSATSEQAKTTGLSPLRERPASANPRPAKGDKKQGSPKNPPSPLPSPTRGEGKISSSATKREMKIPSSRHPEVFQKTFTQKGEPPNSDTPVSAWWAVAIVPLVILILLGAMLPPVDFDVREYHLQAPKEWYQQGRISFLPYNVYANMPLGAEMLALAAMGFSGQWWLGALAGKTAMASLTLVCAAALWAIGRRMISPRAGLVAAALYLATPWIIQVSTAGLNEGVTACYVLLAGWALWLWTEPGQIERGGSPASGTSGGWARTNFPADPSPAGEQLSGGSPAIPPPTAGPGGQPVQQSAWGYLVLGGYLVGAAAGTKYPAVLFLGLPGLVWVGWQACLRASPKPCFRNLLLKVGVFGLAAFLGGGLWYVKNACLAGNPVYPLCYSVLGGKAWDPDKESRWNRVHLPQQFSLGRLADDLSRVIWRSEWIGPLIVPLMVLAFLRRSKQRPGREQPRGASPPVASPLAGEAGQPVGWPGEADRSKPPPIGSGPPKEFPPHPNPLPRRGEGSFSPNPLPWNGAPTPLPPEKREILGSGTRLQEESAFRWLLLGSLVWWIAMWWLLTHRIDRFWLPVLPMAALLAGAGACWSESRLWRYCRGGLLAIGVLYGFLLASGLPAAGGYNRYFVPLERLRHDPERVDPWHLWFNRYVQEGRVLLVGDAQPFDLEVPVFYATCFNTSPLEDILWQAAARMGFSLAFLDSPVFGDAEKVTDAFSRSGHPPDRLGQQFTQTVKQLLAEREIKYIFVHWGEITRYRSPGNYGFTPLVEPELFEAGVRWGVLEPLPPIEDHPGRCYRVRP